MKKHHFALVAVACLALAASPVEAAWAVALGVTGNPAVWRGEKVVPIAERKALAYCSQKFEGCEIVASAVYGCAAFATANNKWGVGDGQTRAAARAAALEACAALKAGECKLVNDFCG